ncbi:MAG: phosphatase PAP2 family protein [Rubrivivax sp.]
MAGFYRGRAVLRRTLLPLAIGLAAAPCLAQDCAWSRVDHRVNYDASGIWNPNAYRSVFAVLTVAQVGGAVWEGSETRFGRTMWQGIDAQIMASVGAAIGKRVFTRVRPSEGNDPCLWFQGGSNYSFPSREAAGAMALVMPYMLEYGRESPAVYALALLPLYDGAARIKNQAHWQTDVLAGWAIGALSGWLAHRQDIPFTIQLLPQGFAVGYKTQF